MKKNIPAMIIEHIRESVLRIDWDYYITTYPRAFSTYIHWEKFNCVNEETFLSATYSNKIKRLFRFFNEFGVNCDIVYNINKTIHAKVWNESKLLITHFEKNDDVTKVEERVLNNCLHIIENHNVCERCKSEIP